jgi:hypothetical protein
VIVSITFSMAMGPFVNDKARQADIPLIPQQCNEVILWLEDETFPKEAERKIAQQVPSLEQLAK